METEKKTVNEISWTWADQISSFRFWGLFLFFGFLLIPNVVISYSMTFIRNEFGFTIESIGTFLSVKYLATLGGFWLAWFLVRMKNHYLLYLYSSLTIIGLILIYFFPSGITFYISFFLIGLGFGAIALAIPTIISGGRGGSEMFIVSFGIITTFEIIIQISAGVFVRIIELVGYKTSILICLSLAIIGTILLIPIKKDLFNNNPPKREFSLTPTFRDPLVVALLCLIPLFNIYYIIHLSFRYHGEVNSINPTQNILSPCAAAWCTLLLSFLAPIMTSSLNNSLISKLSKDGKFSFYKNWAIILWSFIFLPISFALIQSNMNNLINQKAD